MNLTRIGCSLALSIALLTHDHALAIPPTDKLHWGPEYFTMTCKPAIQTKSYLELWPLMTPQEREAVITIQQETYMREQDLYRSWARAFERVLVDPARVRGRGLLYPSPVYESYGIEIAAKGAFDTLAACVEHMARQLELRR